MAKRGNSGIHCLLGVIKPAGLTSHDVVARVRKILGERRVGHAGTLDPMATGVMVLGIGQATRLLDRCSGLNKSYIARITFGEQTNTDDAEGDVIAHQAIPLELYDERVAQSAVKNLEGTQSQVPPAYSAISRNGVRAYAAARAGKPLQIEARQIVVHQAELITVHGEKENLSWDVAFNVSKGTYIRALARDLGMSLGTVAHLSQLERTSSGTVGKRMCMSLDELAQCAIPGDLPILNPATACDLSEMPLSNSDLAEVLHGKSIGFERANKDERCEYLLVNNKKVFARARFTNGMLRMASVFPDGILGVDVCHN